MVARYYSQACRRLSAVPLPAADCPGCVSTIGVTHATHLLASGVNVKVVSERLGHASVSFTLDVFGHVMPDQQASAAAAVAAPVDGVP